MFYKLGSPELLAANRSETRVFIYSEAFYSIFQRRRQQIVFGERPEILPMLARSTRESGRSIKPLELRLPIREFLNSHKEPAILKHFHLRRLLELVRLDNEDDQLARFREMADEIENTF